jgi:hypothetical protein
MLHRVAHRYPYFFAAGRLGDSQYGDLHFGQRRGLSGSAKDVP